jgi:mono/diheme cytochrome c family protein
VTLRPTVTRRPVGGVLPTLVMAATLGALPGAAQQARAGGAPAGELISQGQSLFTSSGLCFACHGMTGSGVPGAGPDLTDDKWTHVERDLQAIEQLIRLGVSSEASTTGVLMPPRGGSQMTDAQIEAVAAYVWSISGKSDEPTSPPRPRLRDGATTRGAA